MMTSNQVQRITQMLNNLPPADNNDYSKYVMQNIYNNTLPNTSPNTSPNTPANIPKPINTYRNSGTYGTDGTSSTYGTGFNNGTTPQYNKYIQIIFHKLHNYNVFLKLLTVNANNPQNPYNPTFFREFCHKC